MLKRKYFMIFITILILTVYSTKSYGQNLQDIPVNLLTRNNNCKDCPKDNFTQKNFLTYAKEEFKNKFPFDSIGTISGGNQGNCEKKEECTLKDTMKTFLNYAKYPIWITFLLSLIKVV